MQLNFIRKTYLGIRSTQWEPVILNPYWRGLKLMSMILYVVFSNLLVECVTFRLFECSMFRIWYYECKFMC